MDDETFKALDTGDLVKMEAIGTVVHVHSNGRVDIKWHGSKVENSVDRNFLTKLEDEE